MKNTDNLSTTHFQIFDYWKDKYICSDGKITDDYTQEPCVPVVEYDTEPMCWGCGDQIVGDYEKKCNDVPDLKLLWNDRKVRSKLNRCHIVPRALGGGVDPSNLFLMCPDCHFESPDTTNVEAFFRWVYRRREEYLCGFPHPRRVFEKIEGELEQRGLPDLATLLKTIPSEKSPEFMKSGYKEWFDKNVGLHTTHLVESSVVVGLTDCILNEIKKCQG